LHVSKAKKQVRELQYAHVSPLQHLPTLQPTDLPPGLPTLQPTDLPPRLPSLQPTDLPPRLPSLQPTDLLPRLPSLQPTGQPPRLPPLQPTGQLPRLPSLQPTSQHCTSYIHNPLHEPHHPSPSWRPATAFNRSGAKTSRFRHIFEIYFLRFPPILSSRASRCSISIEDFLILDPNHTHLTLQHIHLMQITHTRSHTFDANYTHSITYFLMQITHTRSRTF
jgi:hypothetical protein